MGIRGLETFLDYYYNDNQSGIFKNIKLKDLNLVIDGNQFAYLLSNTYKCGHYGGHYDYFYEKIKKLLSKLKNSIEIIIFDGGKENIKKSIRRLENKIIWNANVRVEANNRSFHELDNDVEHLQNLEQYPSLFNKMILFKVLNELGINYKMCDGLADHVISVYANGCNPITDKRFTVLSKASFFNIYDLEGGYLCSKYIMNIFQNVDSLDDNTEFGVFYLKNLLKHFGFQSQLTWIYFCVLMGNGDDIDLSRNYAYFKEHNIDTRQGNFIRLVGHLRAEEKNLLQTGFMQIRETYKSKETLQKIDDLIRLFELKDTDYKTLTATGHNDFINDFDRLFSTIRKLNCNFINCMIEDFKNEASPFFPTKCFLKILYATICQESNNNILQIDQYLRCKNPSSSSLLKMHSFKKEDLLSHNNNDKYINFLYELNEKINLTNVKDNLSLFYLSLIFWNEWINSKIDNSVLYYNAIIYNFVILVCKNALSILKGETKIEESVNINDLSDTSMINFALMKISECDLSKQEIEKIVKEYDDICNQIHDFKSIDLNVYFQSDLPVIHRISEFQAIYYVIGALNKLNKFRFELLYPNRFLNCYFVCKMIQCSNDENFVNLVKMINNCNITKALVQENENKIEFCKKTIN